MFVFNIMIVSLCPMCRAAAHSEVGKYGEAIADCEKAIQIDPSYSKAYSRLGWVYHAQGRFQEAIDMGFQKGTLMLDLFFVCWILQDWRGFHWLIVSFLACLHKRICQCNFSSVGKYLA